MFEVALAELTRAATAVSEAVAKTDSDADALEALLLTYFQAFAGKPRRFQLSHTALPFFDFQKMMAENLSRIRPLNDLVLDGAAQRPHIDAQGALNAARPAGWLSSPTRP